MEDGEKLGAGSRGRRDRCTSFEGDEVKIRIIDLA